MEKNCCNCSVKDTCLKRTLAIFMLYIQTGRMAELTPEVKEKFCITEECKNWKPSSLGQTLQMEEVL